MEAQNKSPKVSLQVSNTAEMGVLEPGSKVDPRHCGAKEDRFTLLSAECERVPPPILTATLVPGHLCSSPARGGERAPCCLLQVSDSLLSHAHLLSLLT